MVECDAVSEICDSNRVRPEKRIITRRLQLQATVKRSRFDLDLDLESQYTLISLWFQTQVSLNRKGQLGCT